MLQCAIECGSRSIVVLANYCLGRVDTNFSDTLHDRRGRYTTQRSSARLMAVKHNIATESEISAPAPGAERDLITAEIAKRAYERMLLLRRFEEKCGQLVALGVVSETAPLATSREAVPVSIALARAPGETFVSATGLYSCLLALGVDAETLFRDLTAGIPSQEARGAEVGLHYCASMADALSTAAVQARQGAAVYCWIDATAECSPVRLPTLSNIPKSELPLVVIANIKSDAAEVVSSAPGLIVSHADSVDVGRIKTLCCVAAARARLKGIPTLILVRTAGFQGHAAKRQEPGARQPSRESWDPVAHLRQRLLDEYGMREAELKALEKAVRDRISSAAAASRA